MAASRKNHDDMLRFAVVHGIKLVVEEFKRRGGRVLLRGCIVGK
jgi:hypothetical protein